MQVLKPKISGMLESGEHNDLPNETNDEATAETDEPGVLTIEGFEVVFDKKVKLIPVDLENKQ